MKRILFLSIAVIVTSLIHAQGLEYCIFMPYCNLDSLNLRYYEGQYLLPEVMTNSSCQRDGITLDVFNTDRLSLQELMESGYTFYKEFEPDMEREYFPDEYNLLMDFAQPYFVDTTVTVIGISAYQYNSVEGYANSGKSEYKYYLELWDSTLNNIIRSADVSDSDYVYVNETPTYTENFFDGPININGKFYVVFHTPDTIMGDPHLDDPSTRHIPFCGMLISFLCTPNNSSMYPLCRNKNNQWETFANWYTNNNSATMFYLFPILGEYNPNVEEWHGVGLNETKDISNFTHVFPNPVKEEININCGYKIKTLQVFDEQGKVLFEKEVNAHNYQINLDSYPTGTYFIKVLTNSGQATKKVVKE